MLEEKTVTGHYLKKFCATGNWCVQLPEKQCCVHALGTNACTKLSRSSPLCCIYMFMFMIRTQEVYTLLIMKLAEHIYRPILSKSCFSCVLPLLLVNATIAQFKATLHYYSISGFLGGAPSNALQFHLPNILDLIASKQ